MKDFKILTEEQLYDGFFSLKKGKIERDDLSGGKVTVEREMLERGDSIAVLLYNQDTNKLIFTRQFRYPTHQHDGFLLEIPAGSMDEGESPEETASREIREETGYKIDELQSIATFYTSPGTTSERIFLYYAEVGHVQKEDKGGGSDSENEDIEILHLEASEAKELLLEINDAKSIIALQWFVLNRRFRK